MTIPAGTRFGRYEVRSPLGAGGMGEVYLAHDTQLQRQVALKVLHADVVSDRKRIARFTQEARAASGLNHPNIITIFEIGDSEGAAFIATEFIDGKTLRQRINSSPMKIKEVLDVAFQVVSALSAAHAAGIVHRDIKPENVMVRRDGYVKVLDFGLAKLTEAKVTDSEGSTLFTTEPGVIMGTALYMSPEQARGFPIDPRTDIWSLGVVLYEMIAGCSPFEGTTKSDVVAAILEREPPPLIRYSREVPDALEWLVTKALNKDREERYQTAKELLSDLKKLKQRVEFELEMERSGAVPSDGSIVPLVHRSSGASGPTLLPDGVRSQASASGAVFSGSTPVGAILPTVSSSEYLVSTIKRNKKLSAIAAAILVLSLGGIGYALYRSITRTPVGTATTNAEMKIRGLTSSGKVENASISPDGKYIAYFINEGEAHSLWVMQVAAGAQQRIIPADRGKYSRPVFTPNGDYVLYGKDDTLYEVAVLGGNPRRITKGVSSPVSFSPDSKRIAFLRDQEDQGKTSVVIANADGTQERSLAERKQPEFFNADDGPAWSPDGNVIACSAWLGNAYELIAIRVADGVEQTITHKEWVWIPYVAWLPDGHSLVTVARARGSAPGVAQLWQLSYPDGEAKRITNDLNHYRGASLSSAFTLASVRSASSESIWTVPDGDFSKAKEIVSGTNEMGLASETENISLTADGAIVYETERNRMDIWATEPDGKSQKQLTSGDVEGVQPSICAGDKYVVFVSKFDVWRIDFDGSNPLQLTKGTSFKYFPVCSPDGRWIVYQNYSDKHLMRVSIDGGESIEVTAHPASRPAISPDGKLIAFIKLDEHGEDTRSVEIVPFEDGPAQTTVELAPTFDTGAPIRWTQDGRSIMYVDTRDGISNIWAQPISGGQLKQLTNSTSASIYAFDWSRDGKKLAVARGTVTSDVVLITNFGQSFKR